MKIFYIANIKLPTEKAHGYQIVKMCEEFGKKIEVELIIPGRKSHIKDDVFEYYDVKENFKIRRLGSFDFFKWEKVLGKLAWIIQRVLLSWAVGGLDMKEGDVVYTREEEVVWVMAKKSKRVVYEAHNWPNRVKTHIKMIRGAYKIICITKGLAEKYIESGLEKEKILIAPDGVDLEKFDIKKTKREIREELDLPVDKKIVIYVGSFQKWKGVNTLIEVAKRIEDVLFILVGGVGELGEALKNVKAVGQKPKREIPKWMAVADVLVLPNSGKENISKFYTSPLKMFEYMASGVPIVASDLPSIMEVLNEENAVLVEADNVGNLAMGIEKVLEDENFGERLADKAKEDSKKYGWDKRVENILKFIK